MSDQQPGLPRCKHDYGPPAMCPLCKAQSELAPAQCSAARALARELAKLISDAEDATPYPSLAPEQLEAVIEKFLEARGLVQQNDQAQARRTGGVDCK